MYLRMMLFLVAMLTVGCATYTPYKQQLPTANYTSSNHVLLSVIDDRFRVKQGRPRDFIGVYRRAFGIPVNKYIDDLSPDDPLDKGATLAVFLERRLTDGLLASGFVVTRKTVQEPPAVDVKVLSEEGAKKWLVIIVKEWYFSIDTHFINDFNFDTEVEVLVIDANDRLVLQKSLKKRDVMKETLERHNDVLAAYKIKLTEILNDGDVKKSLQ